MCIQTFVHNVPYFDHYKDDDDDIHSTTWDPPEEILNDCNISKFEIIKYFLNSKPNSKIKCVSNKRGMGFNYDTYNYTTRLILFKV